MAQHFMPIWPKALVKSSRQPPWQKRTAVSGCSRYIFQLISCTAANCETEAKLVHDRGHHALEDFQDGNCFPLSFLSETVAAEKLSFVITHLRLSRKEVMTFITTKNRVVHFAKHRYTRVYLSHAAVTHNCVNSHKSLRDPKLLKGHRRRTAGGRWVAAQKPSQQHLAGETSLMGLPKSNRSCPGPNDIMREIAGTLNQHSRCQAGPRFSLNQGPVHAGVTVAAKPSGISDHERDPGSMELAASSLPPSLPPPPLLPPSSPLPGGDA